MLPRIVKVAAGITGEKLDDLFGGGGWRKASTCKKVVKKLQARLTDLQTAKPRVVKALSCRTARFVSDGDELSAFAAAEQMARFENTMQLYDLLYESCEVVIGNLSYIRSHSDCPKEIKKAVSTLAFAAPWCPDLPELQIIRRLFFERYGALFDVAAAATLEGFHGSCVNGEVAERLALTRSEIDIRSVMKILLTTRVIR